MLSSLSLGSAGIELPEEDDPNEEHIRVGYVVRLLIAQPSLHHLIDLPS